MVQLLQLDQSRVSVGIFEIVKPWLVTNCLNDAFTISVKEKPRSRASSCACNFRSFLVLINIVVSIFKSIYKRINCVKYFLWKTEPNHFTHQLCGARYASRTVSFFGFPKIILRTNFKRTMKMIAPITTRIILCTIRISLMINSMRSLK